MSRIGRKPIAVPAGVKVTIEGRTVTATGPKGTLSREIPGAVTFVLEADVITVSRPDDSKTNRSMHGLCRTLVANMVEGGKTPVTDAQSLGQKGYRIVIFPGGTARAVAHTLQGYYRSLHQHQTSLPWREHMLDFDGLNAVIGTPELLATGQRYEG